METSFYQLFKLHLMHYLPLTKDAIHVYLGLIVYFCASGLLRRASWWWPVVVVLALSLVMEAFDLRDDFASFGYLRWGASLHDIVNTVFWPAVVATVLRFKLKAARKEARQD